MTERAVPQIPSVAVLPRRLPSLVWLVPIIAALIGVWLVAVTWLEKGPTITIRFGTAEGIEAGKTKIRYKEVDIGDVRAIGLSDDRKSVVVSAQLIKSARDLLAQDSKFFVVRPRISGGTVSGLSTLLSGAYIGIDPGSAHETSKSFVGLENPPVVTGDVPGREFNLHGEEIGSLDYGTPVFYRHINVGHVTRYSLDPNGTSVDVGVFVNAPYDRFVSSKTRFWHASGVDLSVDANGVKLSTESLASLVEGGVAFQDLPDLPSAGEPVSSATSFTLYPNRAQALRLPDQHGQRFVMYFPESVRGLNLGAPVDFRGIVIGEVRSLDVEYESGGGFIRFPVEIEVFPDRLRSRVRNGSAPRSYSRPQTKLIVDGLVAHGMRGELKTGNFLTGQLYIALDFYPEAARAAVDWSRDPPVVPTVPGGLGKIQDAVSRIAAKLDKVPLDRLSAELSQTLLSVDETLKSSRQLIGQLDSQVAPQATRTFNEAEQALRSANAVLGQDAPLQRDVQDALKQVAESARALAVLADYLERHPESLLRGKAKDPR